MHENETRTITTPRIPWATPSMSDHRIEEYALVLERIAGNISHYAGGGRHAHELRLMAKDLRDGGIAPMP